LDPTKQSAAVTAKIVRVIDIPSSGVDRVSATQEAANGGAIHARAARFECAEFSFRLFAFKSNAVAEMRHRTNQKRLIN
jgi:hypothetical protein